MEFSDRFRRLTLIVPDVYGKGLRGGAGQAYRLDWAISKSGGAADATGISRGSTWNSDLPFAAAEIYPANLEINHVQKHLRHQEDLLPSPRREFLNSL